MMSNIIAGRSKRDILGVPYFTRPFLRSSGLRFRVLVFSNVARSSPIFFEKSLVSVNVKSANST